jgi:hypothetical protein
VSRAAVASAAAAVLVCCGGASRATALGPERASCAPPRPAGDATRIERALRAGQDLWGNALLAAPEGPTYDGVRRYLAPLLLARAAKGRRLTQSGFHYVAFGQPHGARGAGIVALHVADGGQILSDRVDGRGLTIAVGADGRERYGACLARLATPRLFAGYLPILETHYTDAVGVRYDQQSFAAAFATGGPLVSWVRLDVDARRAATGSVHVRFTPAVRARLHAKDGRLVHGGQTYLLFDRGGTFDGTSVSYAVPAGTTRVLYAAWLNTPTAAHRLRLDDSAYEAARDGLVAYWEHRLAAGASIAVPERRVLDAERNLLIQDLTLTWRYSIGNPYEEFSFPEGVDVAQVLGGWGFPDVDRAILRTSLGTRPTPYPNWKMGQKLVGSALHFRRFRDRAYIDDVTPALRGYVDTLGRQIVGSPLGILHRERYSSDIPDVVYGLHSQAVVWQGLRWMAQVWDEMGRPALGARCRRLAARLETGLRRAVHASERRLPDGSLFLPAQLLDAVKPYSAVTGSRLGSYWNLVTPYALASGLFPPQSREANGAYAYLLRHGSRLLGLVRAGAYALYGRNARYPTSGTDQVYGTNVSRFLADNDRADQLVLSLYGQLGAAMTPGTFISGEAASIAPLAHAPYRAMYLPPNGAANAAFLETLRLMLVHETSDERGAARGLELAYATPRAWLRPGGEIRVRRVPTSFGPISFTFAATDDDVQVSLDVPDRRPLPAVSLRLRLPRGEQVAAVALGGRPYSAFESKTGTIRLPRRSGHVELEVKRRRSR